MTCRVTLVTSDPTPCLSGREATGRAEGSSAAHGLTGVSASLPSAGETPDDFTSASLNFLSAIEMNLSTSTWLSIPTSSCWLSLGYLATLWTNH